MILWDPEKNIRLIENRNLSFDLISEIILEKKYYDILENKSRKDQFLFIIPYDDYTYAVPFMIDKNNNIILKTIFPSRKFHKIYGDKS